MGTFVKYCKRCEVRIEGARNLTFCSDCGVYKPKERTPKYAFDSKSLLDEDFISYVVGFAYADGSLRKSLRIISTDKHIIDEITSRFGYEREVSVNRKFEDHRKTAYENIFHHPFPEIFKAYGLTEDKEDLGLPSVPRFYSFLRGFMDGDGSITLKSTGSLGTFGFLCREKLKNELCSELFSRGFDMSIYNHGTVYSLRLGGRNGHELLDRMYDSSTIHLFRKAEKYNSMKRRDAKPS